MGPSSDVARSTSRRTSSARRTSASIAIAVPPALTICRLRLLGPFSVAVIAEGHPRAEVGKRHLPWPPDSG